jgi:hypothetical protein
MSALRKAPAFPLAAAAIAFAAGACSEPAGLRVDVAFGVFKSASKVKIVLFADPGGFKAKSNAGGSTVTTQDFDGDGNLDLVTEFLGPFPDTFSFRVTTENAASLTMRGTALAFSDAELVAGADASTTLPGGGAATLSLGLMTRPPGMIGPGTRATDLLTASADLTVNGPARGMGTTGAQASAIAVCNLDGEGLPELVVGAAGFTPDLNLGPTGAVFVAFGAGGAASIQLSANDSSQFSFHGAEGGDELGASVACADLNGDTLDDLIVAAPNAGGGAGRVYVVLGRPNLKATSIDLASTDRLPDATWTTAGANAHLGGALFAGNFGAARAPVVLLAATGAKKVHLLGALTAGAAAGDLDTAPHTTFANVQGTALGAGDLHGTGAALDIIIGDPSYIVPGDIMSSGAVFVFGNVAPAAPTAYDAAATDATGPSTLIVGPRQSGFGSAVLALDTTGHYQDLFVGAPQDGDNGQGRVYVYEHQDGFFLARQRNNSTYKDLLDFGIANAHFGAALGATFSGVGVAASGRLLVGAPDELRGQRAAAGAAYLLDRGEARQYPIVDVLYGANTGDHLGTAVAGGQVNGDMLGDLVTVAPFATGADAGSGVVYVRFAAAP